MLAWALLVHLLVGLSGPTNFWDHYTGRSYLTIAEGILARQGYQGINCCMPLYPLILAGLLKVFGYASLPLLLVHLAVGLSISYFTYKMGRLLFSPAVGLLAGFLISAQPYLVKLTMQIIDTGLSVALTCIAMWLLLLAWKAPAARLRDYLLAGLAFGAATLARPANGVLTILVGCSLIIYLIARKKLCRVRFTPLWLWVGWAIILCPWWIHNRIQYEQFILLTTNGGYNFLKGHTLYYTLIQPEYDTDHFPYLALPSSSNDPYHIAFNEQCFREGFKYLYEHPIEAIRTDIQKIFWAYGWHKTPRTFANSLPRWDKTLKRIIEDGDPKPATQDRLYTIYWTPGLILAITGIILSRKNFYHLLPVYGFISGNMVIIAASFADTRFRLEVDPYLFIWAGYTINYLFKIVSDRVQISGNFENQ